jgi:hypothetical protein
MAATRESMAYSDGMVLIMAVAEIDRVIVPRSSDASGSSESVNGRVEVRGVAAWVAASNALGDRGVVTMIVGG